MEIAVQNIDAEPELHPAIQLLLARMESNPEEFANQHKWDRVMDQFRGFWTAEEKALVKAKQREISMGVMHKEMMKTLFADEPQKVDLTKNIPLTPQAMKHQALSILNKCLSKARSTDYAIYNPTTDGLEIRNIASGLTLKPLPTDMLETIQTEQQADKILKKMGLIK